MEEIDRDVRSYMCQWDGQFRNLKLDKCVQTKQGDFQVRYTFEWDWDRSPARLFIRFSSWWIQIYDLEGTSSPQAAFPLGESHVIYKIEIWC